MKNLNIKSFILTAFILIISANACDFNRIDTPNLAVTEEDFFKEKSEFEQALYNAYGKITDWYWFRGQNYITPMTFLPCDQLTEVVGVYDTWEKFVNIVPNNGFVSYFWTSTYELIQRTNVLIEKTTEANPADFDKPEFLGQIKGEALFLRALANFRLFNMFGTAPLVNRRLTKSSEIHTPLSSGAQLLDQAISDLQAAADLLPAAWDAANRGRATKNSAHGLLLKCLVFRGDYTNNTADYAAAVQAYNKITATLVPNYGHNFSAFHENNNESLFEHQASRTPAVDNVWLQNDGPWRGVEVMSAYWGFFTVVSNDARNNLRGNNWKVTQKMHNAYGGDPRVAYFTESNRNFTKYGKAGYDQLSGTVGSLNNPRILRYAESKLLAAEAILLSGGNKAQAIGLINELRARARNWAIEKELENVTLPEDRNTSETNNAIIMQWIEDERNIELLGEEQIRWFDLKRWDKRGYKNLANWSGGHEHFSTDLAGSFTFSYPTHLLLPIPQVEVDRNQAITSNNPGY
jgi:starch-binding outer membrane protein, SusD/RagB family